MKDNLIPRSDKTRSYRRPSDSTTTISCHPQRATDIGDDFKRATWWSQQHLKSGSLDWYSYDLKHMATLFDREHRYIDKAKVLMVAFYIDLSGMKHPPFVDRALVCMMKKAVKKGGIDPYQLRELYMETVRSDVTPRHIMTVSDSFYLLELSFAGKDYEVETILDGLSLMNCVE